MLTLLDIILILCLLEWQSTLASNADKQSNNN